MKKVDLTRDRVAVMLTAALAVFVLFVLFGWVADIEILKRIHPKWTAMNPMTAVSFLGFAGGLLLVSRYRGSRLAPIAPLFFVIGGIIGFLKLFELFFGVPIHADQLLFTESLNEGATPNRMAPNTALCLVILAGTLLVAYSSAKYRTVIGQIGALVVGLLAGIALLGYLLDFTVLYGIKRYVPMAVHTASSFLILISVLFLTHRDWQLPALFGRSGPIYAWYRDLSIRNKLLYGFATLIALIVLFAAFTLLSLKDIQDTQLPLRASVRALRDASLEMRVAEKNFLNYDVKDQFNIAFFESETSISIDQWEVAYTKFLKNLQDIQTYDTENTLTFDDQLKELVVEYREVFLMMADLHLKRGFTDFGLEGQMRDVVHILEDQLGGTSNGELLSQMRRAEKDFFLRHNLEYVETFDAYAAQLRARISDEGSITLLDEYIRIFHEIVAIDTQIGLSTDQGLQGELLLLEIKMDPLIEKGVTTVLGITSRSIDQLSRVALLLTALFVIVAFGVMLIISRLITRSLDTLTAASSALASGNFKARAVGLPPDEIGAVGASFNKMAEELALSYKKIEDARAKDEAILSGIGDGVFAVTREGNIIVFNKAAEVLSGRAGADVLGKNYKNLLVFEHENGMRDESFIERAFEGIKTEMAPNMMLIRADGTKIAVADSAAPIRNSEGEIIGVAVVFRDVTKEREVDRAKTEFVSLASHQLRTPLSTINWYAEMLLAGDAGPLTEDQKQFIDEIYKGNQRMVDLVNALLNVSRIDLGTFEIDPKPTDLREIADSLLTELVPQIQTREVIVEKSYDDIPMLNIDPKLIRIVLQNLLTNAIKYTPPKGNVNLMLKKRAKDVQVIVSDTGYGIPKEQQSRIFSKLFRADNVRERETDGTGLGLYIVKSVIESSGGTVSFTSVENKGTTFTASLPLQGMKKKEGVKGLT